LLPQATLWGGKGAAVQVQHVRAGTAPMSGTFSLVFAGYGGSDQMYLALNSDPTLRGYTVRGERRRAQA
jgi:hypothetical protein